MTDAARLANRGTSYAASRPGPLGRLAGMSFRRRGRVILAWLFGLGLVL